LSRAHPCNAYKYATSIQPNFPQFSCRSARLQKILPASFVELESEDEPVPATIMTPKKRKTQATLYTPVSIKKIKKTNSLGSSVARVSFGNVPNDIWIMIFVYMKPIDLFNFMRTSKDAYRVLDHKSNIGTYV
jgi:hypothetical protein